MGTLAFLFEWEWERGEQSLKRAIALDPSYTWTYYMYSTLLMSQGRLDEAIEQMQQAQRLAPVSTSPIYVDLGLLYSLNGDLENAARAWQASLELAPNDYRIHRHLGNHFCRAGDFEQGLAKLEHALSLHPEEERLMSDLGYCHALAGHREKARELLEKIAVSREQRYVDPIHSALVHLALGETDRAIEWLERGYQIRAAQLTEVPIDPRYTPLHTDPRFQAIVQGIGLQMALSPPRG